MNAQTDGVGGTLFLYSEVGPLENYDDRKLLIECIEASSGDKTNNLIKFRRDAKSESAKYSKFFNYNSVRIKDINDAEEIGTGMRNLLEKFIPVFEAVKPSLEKFSEERGKSDG